MNKFYIFGAHSRAQTTAEYVKTLHPDWELLGFLVDDEEKNASELMGVPVQHLDKKPGLDMAASVYLGIRGVGFVHVTEALQKLGFDEIIPVTPELDRELRMAYMKTAFSAAGRSFELLEEIASDGDVSTKVLLGVAHGTFDEHIQDAEELRLEERFIQAGAAISDDRIDCSFYDNDGDNISYKNRQFCELTALYWLWRNCSAEWIGLEHYRRRFILPEDWTARLGQVDAILPVPLYVYPSLEGNFVARHKKQVWEMAIQILSEQHPDMQEAVTEFFSKQGCYSPCNMLIARREVLDNLCSWLFPMLFDLEERVGMLEDSYQNRYPGFVSERFISFFFWYYRDKYNVVYSEKNFLS